MRWAGAEHRRKMGSWGSFTQRNTEAGTPLLAALPAGGSSYPSQESVPQVGTGLDLLIVKEAGNQLWFPPTPSLLSSPSRPHPHKDTFSF